MVLAAAIALAVVCAPAWARAAAAVAPESATAQGAWTTIVRHVPSNVSLGARSNATSDSPAKSGAGSRASARFGPTPGDTAAPASTSAAAVAVPVRGNGARASSAPENEATGDGNWLNIDGIDYQRGSLSASGASSGAAGIPWQGAAWVLAGGLVLFWRWRRRHRRRQLATAVPAEAPSERAPVAAAAAATDAEPPAAEPPAAEPPAAEPPAAEPEAPAPNVAAPAPAEAAPAATTETPAPAVIDALALPAPEATSAAPEPVSEPVSAPVAKVAATIAPAAAPMSEPSPPPPPVAEAAKPAPARRKIRIRILTAADAEEGGADVAVEALAAKRLAEARAMLLLRGMMPMAETGDAAPTPANAVGRRAAPSRPTVTVRLAPVKPLPPPAATRPETTAVESPETEKRTLLRLV